MGLFVRSGEREVLLVYLPPLVNIRVQVNLGCLNRRVAKVFLDNPQVFRAFIELAGIAVTDLMGGYPRRSVMFEDMLDCPGRDMLSLLTNKERARNTVSNEFHDLGKRVFVNENKSDLVSFSSDPDRMLVKINVLNIHIAELGDTDTRCIDRPYYELVAGVINGVNQAEHLVVLEIFYLLLLDPGAVDPRQGIDTDDSLGREKTIK